MSPIRVLLTKHFFDEDLAYLRSRIPQEIEFIVPSAYRPDVIAEAVQDNIHVLLGGMMTRDILTNGRALKLVQIPWTGVDQLDFAMLREFDVPVCNSHSNALAVAEMAVGLALGIVKKIPLHDARLRTGRWMRPQRGVEDSHIPPVGLSGKSVGFIGFGAIGGQIAHLLGGFNVTFSATVNRPRPSVPAPLTRVYSSTDNCLLAAESDLIFVTAPLTNSTRNLIDAKFFEAMRPTSYLVNVSRGEIVNEEALYNALKSRQIAGAAIDTWYQYPKPDQPDVLPSARFPFHELDNLVLSPHRAGFIDGELPHLADVVTNLNRLAAGETPINRIDPSAGF